MFEFIFSCSNKKKKLNLSAHTSYKMHSNGKKLCVRLNRESIKESSNSFFLLSLSLFYFIIKVICVCVWNEKLNYLSFRLWCFLFSHCEMVNSNKMFPSITHFTSSFLSFLSWERICVCLFAENFQVVRFQHVALQCFAVCIFTCQIKSLFFSMSDSFPSSSSSSREWNSFSCGI